MNNHGDVWISTVLYTLIGLALVGSLVAMVNPEVARLKDKAIIEQTVQSLNVLDDTIIEARKATGTRLNYIISLDKGNLIIDSANEAIYWQMDSRYQFSEKDQTMNLTLTNMRATTRALGGLWNVTLILDYKGYGLNITADGRKEAKTLSPSSLPYSIWIKNNGISKGAGSKLQNIDFSTE